MLVRAVSLVAAFATSFGACAGNISTDNSTGNTTTGAGRGNGAASAGPHVGGCRVLPSDNAWNEDVSKLAVRSDSQRLVSRINASRRYLHADFGTNPEYGIPFVVVPSTEPRRAIHYTAYGDESDPGPFPIPPNAPVEGGASSDGDRHVIVVQRDTCKLFELYRSYWRNGTARWDADAGATWSLSSNKLRPLGWTS